MAFLTTSLTVFSAICLVVAIPIRDFKSVAVMEIATSGVDPEKFIREIVDQEVSDVRLLNHLAAVSDNTEWAAGTNAAADRLSDLKQSFVVEIDRNGNGDHYCLTAQFFGTGAVVEQVLVEQIMQRIGSRLNDAAAHPKKSERFLSEFSELQDHIQRNSSARHAELTAAYSMVDRLNNGLSQIHSEVELFQQPPESGNQLERQSAFPLQEQRIQQLESILAELLTQLDQMEATAADRNARFIGQATSEFRSQLDRLEPWLENQQQESTGAVSPMRVVNALMPEKSPQTNSILQSLNELDTDVLQSKLVQIQQNLRLDATQTSDAVASLNLLARDLSNDRIRVDSISAVRTLPTDPLPGRRSLLLFTLASIVMGAMVAVFYRPELDGVGFASAEKISSSLGLPLVAELPSNHPGYGLRGKDHCAANVIVSLCQIVLFGLVLLILLFCLLESDIRAAFMQNPFMGLAKVIGNFVGN